ncbi:MAG: FHA domain-containing protein [Anaerolineaceae bacterium]|nr:FHA domain-containing protein [Anaerolineaceae bacterium]
MSDPQTTRLGIPVYTPIQLVISGSTSAVIDLDFSDPGGFVVGRSDSKSSYTPDIDLSAHRALENGVSRRHAALIQYQDMLHLLDLNSVNGTQINGERLSAELPYLICPNDQILLGSLALTIEVRR